MKALPTLLGVAVAVAAPCAVAGGDHYNDALANYKGETKPQQDPELVNADFHANRAVSTARRAMNRAGVDDALSQDGGDVNVASPRIVGNVRGNVTVVMQRGAVRGSIISVRR